MPDRDEDVLRTSHLDAIVRVARRAAHQLNNYVMVLEGGIDILEARIGTDPEGARRMLSTMADAVESTKKLSASLVVLRGGDTRRVGTHDPAARAEAWVAARQARLPADVALEIEVPDEPMRADMDPDAFDTVLAALVGNAIEADAHEILVRVAAPPDRPDSVLVEVRDDGHGMDEEIQARIHEPFFTTRDTKENQGLGLALVWGFTHQCGATVRVESTPGEGTVVRLFLHRSTDPLAADEPQDARASTSLPDTQATTILLVDDAEEVLSFVCTVLERMGHVVLAASSGEHALRLMEEHGDLVQLLITDIVMPGMNGPEVARRFLDARPSARVLYISGFPEDTLSSMAGHLPTPLLPKPFTATDLQDRVRQVLASG